MVPTPQATVLAVDDNPTNLAVVFDALAPLQFRVLTAENGEIALRRAEIAQPDVILLDVMMPGIDGFETCRRLKALPGAVARTPVIFMTARTDEADRVRGFEAGGVDYVTKPLFEAELRARLETHLRIARLERDLRERVVERDQALTELDAFTRLVAHDLRNSLAGAFGFAEALSMEMEEATEPVPEDWIEMVGHIRYAGSKANEMIEGLALLSGLRTRAVEKVELDLGALVLSAGERYNRRAGVRPLKLREPAQKVMVTTDRALCEDLFLILLRETAHLNPPGRGFAMVCSIEERSGAFVLQMEISGRTLTAAEGDAFLHPLVDGARRKVEGVELLVVGLSRIAELLGLTLKWAPADSGNSFWLHFPKT